VPKYPGHRMGEWHWRSWGGPLPAAVVLNFVTRSGVGFTNGSQIKPAPDFGSGSSQTHGCKIELTPAPIGSKTCGSPET
jgi:hypothetical protein